jgi:ABC-2 type transport system permease protein
LEALRMSSQFAAADLFVIAPLASAAPVFHGARKAVLYYLLAPAMAISGAICALLAPAGRESLLLAIPGLIAIPAVSLLPALMRPYLPLSGPAARGEQTARNLGLTFTTMVAMAGVLGVSFVVSSSGWWWEFVALETVVVTLLYWAFNRRIHHRPLRPDREPTPRPWS